MKVPVIVYKIYLKWGFDVLSVKFKRIFSKVVEVMLVILNDIKVSCIVFLSDCKI